MLKKIVPLVCFCLAIIMACNNKPSVEENKPKNLPVDSVLNSLTQKISGNPKDASLYFERAEVYIKQNKYKLAYDDLIISTSLDTVNFDYFFKLSEVSFNIGKTRDTKVSLDKCLAIDPENIEAKLKLAELYLYVREYKKSLALLQEVTKKDIVNYKANFLKGINFQEAGDTANAIKSFQRTVELNENYYNAYMQLGILYGAKHDKIAIDYYNNALNLSPKSTEALYAKALFLQNNGDIKGAVNNYNMLIQADSTYYFTYYNLGYIAFNMEKDYRKSTVWFTKALKFNPAYAEAYYMRGYSFENLGEYAKGIRDYTDALKIAPGFELAQIGLERIQKK
jgi:tetratricopeptide (TPR) repeat protein